MHGSKGVTRSISLDLTLLGDDILGMMFGSIFRFMPSFWYGYNHAQATYVSLNSVLNFEINML